MLKQTVEQLKKIVEDGEDTSRDQLIAEIRLVATKLEVYDAEMTPMQQAFSGLSMEIDRILRDESDQARFARVERLSQICQSLKRESVASVEDLCAQGQNIYHDGGGMVMHQNPGRRGRMNVGGYVGAGGGGPYGMAQDPDGDPLLDGIREIAQGQRQPAVVARAQELRDLAAARKDLVDGGLDTAAVDARIAEIQEHLAPKPEAKENPQPNGRDPDPAPAPEPQ